MPSLRRILFQDLGTKTLALILALAIYVHVFSGQEREMNFRVPLHVAPLPSDLALVGGYPEEVRIRVRATGAEEYTWRILSRTDLRSTGQPGQAGEAIRVSARELQDGDQKRSGLSVSV